MTIGSAGSNSSNSSSRRVRAAALSSPAVRETTEIKRANDASGLLGEHFQVGRSELQFEIGRISVRGRNRLGIDTLNPSHELHLADSALGLRIVGFGVENFLVRSDGGVEIALVQRGFSGHEARILDLLHRFVRVGDRPTQLALDSLEDCVEPLAELRLWLSALKIGQRLTSPRQQQPSEPTGRRMPARYEGSRRRRRWQESTCRRLALQMIRELR